MAKNTDKIPEGMPMDSTGEEDHRIDSNAADGGGVSAEQTVIDSMMAEHAKAKRQNGG